MYRLLALDLDGTLVNSQKEITPHTLNVLAEVQQRKTRIVLASGRPPEGITPLATQLCLRENAGFIMAFNGGLIIDCPSGEHLCENYLDPAYYPLLYQKCHKEGFAILTYLDGHIASEDIENPYVRHNAWRNGMPLLRLDNMPGQITFPEPKWLVVGEADRLSVLEKELQSLFSDKLSIYRSEPYFLEILPAGIDKGNGLRFIAERMNIQPKEIMACGDNYNDAKMLQYAGLGIAMAGAEDAVKDVADFITLSNDQDGVAYAAERFLLSPLADNQ